MKITIYELLGLVKDGKAPKKIKFNNIYCYYRECKNEYVDYTNKPIIKWDYVVMNSLNKEVEILEEEKKIPEKIDVYVEDDEKWIQAYNYDTIPLDKKSLSHEELVIIKTLNQLIDYLKSKGE